MNNKPSACGVPQDFCIFAKQERKVSSKQFYQSLNDLPNNGMIKQITLSTLFLYLMESFMLVHNVIQEVRKVIKIRP